MARCGSCSNTDGSYRGWREPPARSKRRGWCRNRDRGARGGHPPAMVAALAHVPVPTPVPVAIYKAALPRLLAAAPSLLKTAGGRSPLPDPPPFRPCPCFSPAPCRFGPAKSFSAPNLAVDFFRRLNRTVTSIIDAVRPCSTRFHPKPSTATEAWDHFAERDPTIERTSACAAPSVRNT